MIRLPIKTANSGFKHFIGVLLFMRSIQNNKNGNRSIMIEHSAYVTHCGIKFHLLYKNAKSNGSNIYGKKRSNNRNKIIIICLVFKIAHN